jgi:hypothetical protein
MRAKAACGVSNREADAMFFTVHFWQVRSEILRYADD